MHQELRRALVCAALVGSSACGNGDPSLTTPDDGAVDSDENVDAVGADGGSSDTGSATLDGAVDETSASVGCGAWDGLGKPLPDACLPRCRATTRPAYDACAAGTTGNVCRAKVLENDNFETATVAKHGKPFELHCIDCWQAADSACQASVCGPEYAAMQACANENPMDSFTACMTQRNAESTCVAAKRTKFDECMNGAGGTRGLFAACFAA